MVLYCVKRSMSKYVAVLPHVGKSMRAVEELVRRKLEKRAPDELPPKPDPYELRAPQGCSLLFHTATQMEGNQSGQTLLSQNPIGVKLQRRLIVKHATGTNIGKKLTTKANYPIFPAEYTKHLLYITSPVDNLRSTQQFENILPATSLVNS